MGPHPGLDVHARVIQAITSMQFMPLVVEVPLAGSSGDGLLWNDFVCPGGRVEPVGLPDRIGALVHTGGTTGHPKLARLSLRNMASAALMANAGLGIQKTERLLTGLPLFHVGGAIDALLATLAAGGTVVFPTPMGMRNPEVVRQIWRVTERHQITLIGGVPTSLAAIVDSPVGIADLSKLRAVMTGGSSLSKDLSQRLQIRIGKPVCQLYGMTETSGIATAQLTTGLPVTHTAGFPVPHAEISIGAPGAAYRPGAKGEILVRGPNLFHGYLTAQGVIDDPHGTWFYSGDLGEVGANGELSIVGRSKDVIIRSGHNIDPQVIEDVAHQHPAVSQAAAVAMPDDYAGEVPVLFVVPRPGVDLSVDELATFLTPLIAEPPARPKRIFLVKELPLTAFAKVARFRLRQMAVEYRVKELLKDVAAAISVSCSDPAAKRVAVQGMETLAAAQVEEITRTLRPFDLQVEG